MLRSDYPTWPPIDFLGVGLFEHAQKTTILQISTWFTVELEYVLYNPLEVTIPRERTGAWVQHDSQGLEIMILNNWSRSGWP